MQSRVRELEDDLDQIRNSLPDLANSNTPISSIATHLQTSLSSISDLQQEVSCLKEKLQHAEEARMKYEDHINVLKGKIFESIHFCKFISFCNEILLLFNAQAFEYNRRVAILQQGKTL